MTKSSANIRYKIDAPEFSVRVFYDVGLGPSSGEKLFLVLPSFEEIAIWERTVVTWLRARTDF